MKNIALVGFMGTGKTTVGKILARRMNYAFVDIDALIEKEQGAAITRIFSEFGEPYFRKLEADMISRLSCQEGLVISAGGGAVMDSRNVDNLKMCGSLVCLTASPEVILKRVGGSTHRPLLKTPDPLGRVKELLAARAPYYARADITVDTDGLTAEEAAGRILDLVGEL